MRRQESLVEENRRLELEDAVFDALRRMYDLPPSQAVAAAGFVAGQIAAFLADTAKLTGDREDADEALGALADLETNCEELLSLLSPAARKLASMREGLSLAEEPRTPPDLRAPPWGHCLSPCALTPEEARRRFRLV